MQVTIDLPDQLSERIRGQWKNLPQEILRYLMLRALKEGLINLKEFNELVNFSSEAELHEFLRNNDMLHRSGLLNLYGSCADIDFDFEIDDSEALNEIDEDFVGALNE